MWNTAFRVVAAAVATIAASAVLAQQVADDAAIEEVLVYGSLSRYSALKSDIPILESARSVSIETEQQFIDKGALVLDDIYTYTAGVTGETFGFATRGDFLRVRGLDVAQFQDSLQSLFGNFNNTRPDIYTLEQVEILKGPASVLFGQGSPGGLVNVVSKRPRDESRHEIILEGGNFDRAQLSLDSTGALDANNDWLYRVVALYRDTGTQINEVDDETVVFAPSLTWRPNDRSEITVLFNYRDTESDTAAQFLPIAGTLDPAPNGQRIDFSAYYGDPDFNFYDATTTSFTLLSSYQFNDVFTAEVTARRTDGEADYQQTWPSFIGGDRYVRNPDGSLYEDGTVPRSFFGSNASSEQSAVDLRLRANFSTGDFDHRMLMGLQYQDVTTDDDRFFAFALGYNFLTAGPNPPLGDQFWINLFDPVYGQFPDAAFLESLRVSSPSTDFEDIGLYLNNEISAGNWRVTLGLRYDESETQAALATQKDDELSAAVGVLYQFDNGFAPYISYSDSFQPVVGDNGNGQPLEPQRGEQWEAGIKYQPSGIPAFVTLAVFDIEQTNLPDPLAAPGTFEQQRGVAEVQGVELEAQVSWGDFSLEANASYLETESPDGFQFPSVPETQASAWLGYEPSQIPGLRLGVGVRYVGDSLDGVDQIETPSYTLGDLLLGYGRDKWDATLNVRNVTDKEYLATCIARGDCFVGDERTIVARLRYLF